MNTIQYIKLLIRKGIYASLFLLDTYILRKKPGIFLLCYHGISSDTWKYSIDLPTLKKQILYLLKKGYTPITLDELVLFIQNKKILKDSSFIITIDDGYKEVLELRQFFKENNIHPAVFVLSERANANRKELENDRAFLTRKEMQVLQKEGWIIGSHSATHSNFSTLTPKEIVYEVIDSKEDLEKELGFSIQYFAYPKGRYTRDVLTALNKAGYKLALSMHSGFVTQKTNPLLIPRIGIDRTYSFREFTSIFLPSSVWFRNIITKYLGVIV